MKSGAGIPGAVTKTPATKPPAMKKRLSPADVARRLFPNINSLIQQSRCDPRFAFLGDPIAIQPRTRKPSLGASGPP